MPCGRTVSAENWKRGSRMLIGTDEMGRNLTRVSENLVMGSVAQLLGDVVPHATVDDEDIRYLHSLFAEAARVYGLAVEAMS